MQTEDRRTNCSIGESSPGLPRFILFLLLSCLAPDSQTMLRSHEFNTEVPNPTITPRTQAQVNQKTSLDSARSLLARQEQEAALEILDEFLNQNRTHSEAWMLKARAHSEMAQYRAALKSLDRSEALAPGRPTTMLGRGQIYVEQRAYGPALEALNEASRRATTRNPEFAAEIMFWRGQVHERRGDMAQARTTYRNGLKVWPKHKLLLARLEEFQIDSLMASAEVDLEKRNRQAAVTKLQQILTLRPNYEPALLRLKELLPQVKSQPEAKQIETAAPAASLAPLKNSKTLARHSISNTQSGRKPALLQDAKDATLKAEGATYAQQAGAKDSAQGQDEIAPPAWRSDAEQADSFTTPVLASLIVLAFGATWLAVRGHGRRKPEGHMNLAPRSGFKTIVHNFRQSQNRHVVNEQIGAGSMGCVFKGFDSRLERVVALKFIHFENTRDEDDCSERITRFRREAKATARLHHKNIVRLLDYQEVGGNFCMIMEFVDGVSLRQRQQEHGPPELKQAVDWTCQTLEALEYAHQRHLIHRDLKPSNLMLSRDGELKMLDFWLAKFIQMDKAETYTRLGNPVGTPYYMSPEQINSGPIDGRADLFSLGVVFYEMLTGRLPFAIERDDEFGRLFYKILNNPLKLPGRLVPGVSAELDGLVGKMLARPVAERFSTAGETLLLLRQETDQD